MRLSNNNGEVLTGKTAEQCAFACEQEVSFPCRSLDYDRTNGTCYLSSEDSEGGVLTQAKGYDFYQMSMFLYPLHLSMGLSFFIFKDAVANDID